jgi:hypothetical protein
VAKNANTKLWAISAVSNRRYSDPANEPGGGGGDFAYYIGPSGSDSNDGLTPETAWAITAINTKRATYAGFRVGLLNGTYATGGISPYAGGDTPSLGVPPGDSDDLTIIEAVNENMAVIDHAGGGIACMGAYDATAGYFEIRGLKFINCRDFCIYINRTSGRGLGITVDSCEFTQQLRTATPTDLTSGVFLQATTNAVVRNCWFHDIENSVQASSVSAVLQYGTIDNLIERCTFDGTYAGVHSKYAGGTPRVDDQSTTVRQCYFRGNVLGCRGFDNKDQSGLGFPPTSPPYGAYILENNIFEDVEYVLGNDGSFSSSSPITVRNNTIYWRSAGAKQGFNLYTRASGQGEPSVYNNIFSFGGSSTWTETRAFAVTINGSGAALTGAIDYNCYHGAMQWTTQEGYGYPYYGGSIASPSSKAAWQSATGCDDDGRSLFATDPLFAMTGDGPARFILGGSSPCLSTGKSDGTPSGSNVHMGAWTAAVISGGGVGCNFAEYS